MIIIQYIDTSITLNSCLLDQWRTRKKGRRSKMVTGTQMQTAWAPWIRDLAETLETYLAEVKHKGEQKLWHPEPLAHGRLFHIMIHWKNRWAAACLPAHQASSLQTCWANARAPPHRPIGQPPPQEGSSTTRCWFQTCLGDTDKQDWMLKE
jgi:hypothetical protein